MQCDHPYRSVTVLAGTLQRSARRTPVLISAALGLLIGDALAGKGQVLPAVALAAIGGAAVVLLIAGGAASKRAGVLILALATANVRAAALYHPRFTPDHMAMAPMQVPLRVQGVLAEDAEASGERVRLLLDMEWIDGADGWRRTRGQVLLTVAQVEERWIAGDRLEALLTLRRPRNLGNPGEFDYEAYLARRGIYVTAFAQDDAGLHRLGHADEGLAGWLQRWRRGVAALFARSLPPTEAGVLGALIVGTETALPRELRTAFSRAGVSHVLSISGLHVALVAGAGYALFRWLLARSRRLLLGINVPKLATALSIIPVLLYAGIAGSNVATIRSVIMILVLVLGTLVDRQRHLVVSLALAAILILLWSPGAALDISFQLSFAAVLGLVWGMERFWPWWKAWEERRLLRLRGRAARLWRPIVVYAMVSIIALAATLPLTALHFNQVSLVAPLANALVVPLLGSAAVGLGLLAALAYLASETLAYGCVVLARPFVTAGVWLVYRLSSFPYASIRVVTPNAFELAVGYAGLLAVVRLSRRARVVSLAVVVLLALGDAGWWYVDRYHRADMRVTFLSVGQGDSAVVEFPGAAVMIIDAGGLHGENFDLGERVIAPFLWSRKIGHVDYLVLSHPEWDHYGGFAFLAEHFSPHEFWSNGTAAATDPFAHLQEALGRNGVERLVFRRGDRREIAGVQVAVDAPRPQLDDGKANDHSLVMRLNFHGLQVLFPGDIESAAEQDLVTTAADGSLVSAILKVPHHGSNTSSTAVFLDAVRPTYAIVSAGFQNRFHFPDERVLQRYAAAGCRLLRTDLDGAVRVRIGADGDVALQATRPAAPQ